jgi:hypothetical protein
MEHKNFWIRLSCIRVEIGPSLGDPYWKYAIEAIMYDILPNVFIS